MILNVQARARPTALAATLALSLLGLLAAPAPAAHADALQGNARFTSSGQRVVDYSAAGIGCRVFGFCDDVTAATVSKAITRQRSQRQGEPLLVLCTVGRGGPLYRVALDLDGDSTFDGLTTATGVAVDRGVRLAPC